MDENRVDLSTTFVRMTELKPEDGAEELANSQNMQPYLRLALAVAEKQALNKAIADLAALPLEQRYIWRVVSALKWAFADYDSLNIVADCKTLSPEQLNAIDDLVKNRPVQFCLFISALYGDSQMEQMMLSAIRTAKSLESPEPTEVVK